MGTEYRIIPCSTYFGDKYLQFKSIEIISKRKILNFFCKTVETKEVWRFVPQNLDPMLLFYICENDCPTELTRHQGRFMYCQHGKERILRDFAKNNPDISEYFKELKNKRITYLDNVEKTKNFEVEYL